MLGVIGLGVVVFATTNIDDILLLAAFFADRTLRPRAIVIGQFAGIGALTAVSAVAALLALTIPEGWIGLLGLVPLALGMRGLYASWRPRASDHADDDEAGDVHVDTRSRMQWGAVASVTIANGGDNLGVYIRCSHANSHRCLCMRPCSPG